MPLKNRGKFSCGSFVNLWEFGVPVSSSTWQRPRPAHAARRALLGRRPLPARFCPTAKLETPATESSRKWVRGLTCHQASRAHSRKAQPVIGDLSSHRAAVEVEHSRDRCDRVRVVPQPEDLAVRVAGEAAEKILGVEPGADKLVRRRFVRNDLIEVGVDATRARSGRGMTVPAVVCDRAESRCPRA